MEDRFGSRAAAYAAARPDYPEALIAWAASLPARRAVAWDCGTGSGQAAVALARRFGRVVATDRSPAQIARARPHPGVDYRVAPADASGLDPASVDLVAVAQALHWFDLDAFYAEARRVLAPGGAVAAWTYGDPVLDQPALDATLRRFNLETMDRWWAPERRHVQTGYRELPFPFAEVEGPSLALERAWTLDELLAYVRTWSSVSACRESTGADPVVGLEADLRPAWGEPGRRRLVRWPLSVRAGRP